MVKLGGAALFDPGRLGSLTIRNRMVRSATAEMMADADGRPLPSLTSLVEDLAAGGVGLIILGHMFVHPSGKAHPGMTGIHDDTLVPDLSKLAEAAHRHGARIAVQINHSGRQTRSGLVERPLAPSDVPAHGAKPAAHAVMHEEIEMLVDAYGQAARRARQAGFDAVQIHAAHGYLVSQFLSPLANHRTDAWGGTLRNRLRFLASVVGAVRREVGLTYPVLTKLGLRDEAPGGLSLEQGLSIVSELASMGLNAVELSGGLAQSATFNIVGDVAPGRNEAYFRSWAQQAAAVAEIPILLVGGLRSRSVMEEVLSSGDAQFVSLCRPLICEPDLPNRLAEGLQEASACVSHNRCWPKKGEVGISCRCPGVVRRPRSSG